MIELIVQKLGLDTWKFREFVLWNLFSSYQYAINTTDRHFWSATFAKHKRQGICSSSTSPQVLLLCQSGNFFFSFFLSLILLTDIVRVSEARSSLDLLGTGGRKILLLSPPWQCRNRNCQVQFSLSLWKNPKFSKMPRDALNPYKNHQTMC